MAQLEAVVEAELAKNDVKERNDKTKPRLQADPSVGVTDLVEVIRGFCAYRGSTDLSSLICSSSNILSWKTKPEPDFLLKVSGLVYELALLAPTTKLSGKKLRLALDKLFEGREIRNTTGKDTETFLDNCDVTIRIALAQYRLCKQNVAQRETVTKRLSKRDQIRLTQVLNRFHLPEAAYAANESEEEGQVDQWNPSRKVADNVLVDSYEKANGKTQTQNPSLAP